jgi:hypothetical protein
MNIVIIGAGQIGSRHLQAITNLNEDVLVQLVDTSPESLRISKERFYEVGNDSQNIKLFCHGSMDSIEGSIDVAIIATCSDTRSSVIKELTHKKKVKYFILEKVLFPSIAEYYEIAELLEDKNILAWVNCYMRSRDFYKELKKQIDSKEKIDMKVEGVLWGLGCNSIHFMDYFSFLTDCIDFNFTEVLLDKETIVSKRSGFIEFTGMLAGENSRGDSLVLVCHPKGDSPVKISIKNGSQSHDIAEHIDHVIHNVSKEGNKFIKKVNIPFQSQTTHKLISQIIDRNECDLTKYNESMKLHIPLINTFLGHMEKITGICTESCPIT